MQELSEFYSYAPEVKIAIGRFHTIIINALDNKAYSVGKNENGQLGLGDLEDRDALTLIPSLEEVATVSCGFYHTVVITGVERSVYAFGENYMGNIGVGDNESRNAPTLVPFDEHVSAVSCGFNHTAFITESGKLYLCGLITDGYFEEPEDPQRWKVPRLVPLEEEVVSVSCGMNYTIAITSSGGFYAVGFNLRGQLGIGNFKTTIFPKFVRLAEKVVKASCGGSHSALITSGGNLYMFGNNGSGQLGLGEASPDKEQPTLLAFEEEVIGVTCGFTYTAIITKSGSLYMCGSNLKGQLSFESKHLRADPELVLLPEAIVAVCCSYDSTVAVGESGELYSFGDDVGV